MNSAEVYRAVQERYSAASKDTLDDTYASAVAASFGYSKADLESIHKDANLGLSCGNPLVIAGLKEGETVIDLGSGAGLDVFLASKKVGATGRAIGVDMNDDMLAKARRNKELMNVQNAEFVRAPITDISPLPANSADCIISNCVINLVPEVEKQLAFNEMARLLKRQGRLAISDILLKKDLTPALKQDRALYVGCVAGASQVEDYEHYLHAAGFKDVLITDTNKDLNVYKDCLADDDSASFCAKPSSKLGRRHEQTAGAGSTASEAGQSDEVDYNEYAGAFKIYAVLAA